MKKPGFSSTESRMRKTEKNMFPGPGNYIVENNADKIKKRIHGRQGIFGSSERRFPIHTVLVILI